MAVISLTITESAEQIVSGIPVTISFSTNVPATIFYVLDGSVPTTASEVYVTTIILSTALPSPRLRVFATNGTDSSAIIEKDYGPNVTRSRLPHASVTGLNINATHSLGPFGTNSTATSTAKFTNPADAGITVLAPDLTTYSSGHVDADGYGAALINEPTVLNYHIIQTDFNSGGHRGPGIGTIVPVTTLPERNNDVPQESNRANKLFNPRAMVIFQDASTEDTSAPPQLNREYFSMEIPEKEKDATLLSNCGPDTATATGSFLRAYHNPRDNTITYYYRDSATNRWLISKQPYQLRDPNIANLSNMVFGREQGQGFVFRWVPFSRRVLT